MMRSLTWKRRDSVATLAKQWGMTEQYIREMSAEASKQVRAEIANPETVQATVCAALDWAIHDAKRKGKHTSVTQACRVWADITGATAARRLEVRMGRADAELELPEDPQERALVLRAMAERDEEPR